MFLKIISNYKSINPGLSGRNLTDYLIIQCVSECREGSFQVRRSGKGKPFFTDGENESPVHVSVSHSMDVFACIISPVNIGLDIQHARDVDAEKLAARYYTEKETDMVRKDRNEFFRLWARKEAYSKYTGEGLSDVMGKTDVTDRDDVVFRDMIIECRPGESCFAAVCAGKGADLNEIQISC